MYKITKVVESVCFVYCCNKQSLCLVFSYVKHQIKFFFSACISGLLHNGVMLASASSPNGVDYIRTTTCFSSVVSIFQHCGSLYWLGDVTKDNVKNTSFSYRLIYVISSAVLGSKYFQVDSTVDSHAFTKKPLDLRNGKSTYRVLVLGSQCLWTGIESCMRCLDCMVSPSHITLRNLICEATLHSLYKYFLYTFQ